MICSTNAAQKCNDVRPAACVTVSHGGNVPDHLETAASESGELIDRAAKMYHSHTYTAMHTHTLARHMHGFN